MKLSRTNIVLAVLLVVTTGLAAVSQVDRSQPNFEFLPEMKHSPAWQAFDANPVLPGGRTLQEPVPGTIARGEIPLHYAATKEDAERAGRELINPYQAAIDEAAQAAIDSEKETQPDPEKADRNTKDQPAVAKEENKAAEELRRSTQRGAAVYATFCACCHGPKGAGDGPVANRAVLLRPPSLLQPSKKKDGQLFHLLTYGQGRMAPMAAQLSRAARWDVINFVRSLESTGDPTKPADATDSAEAQP